MSDKIKRIRANIFDISPFGKGFLFNLNRKEKLKELAGLSATSGKF